MKKIRKIHEITAENDMRYRGPLSSRHIKILGWVCLTVSQIGVILNVAESVNKELNFSVLLFVISLISGLTIPCFLLANFSVILTAREGFKKLLLRFGCLSAAFFAAFLLLFTHIGMGIASSFTGSRAKALEFFDSILSSTGGYVAFNLFLDLFLCTLIMFFLFHQPKRFFLGKKLILFRLFAVLPILYEGASVLLKVLSSVGQIRLSIYVCPFLTTKPPVMFLVFVVLALFLKRRERKFLRRGKTLEEYKAFLETNSNSFRFSVFTSVLFAVAAAVDLLLMILLSAAILVSTNTELTDASFLSAIGTVEKWGFGESINLILLVPLVLLFSYTRIPKKPKIDLCVTAGGVAAIVCVYIEGFYQIICMIPALYK